MAQRDTCRTVSRTSAEAGCLIHPPIVAAPVSPFTLAHWRRTVAEHYSEVRVASRRNPRAAAMRFRAAREQLFREHIDSPIPEGQRASWKGLGWYDYDPGWSVAAAIERGARQTE